MFQIAHADGTRARLWAEFATLYLVAPVAMALVLPPELMFPALFSVMAVGLWLLNRSPGFRWSALLDGAGRIDLRLVLGLAVVTAATCVAIMSWVAPGNLFGLARHQPRLLVMILLLYPILSALPQELIYRALYYARYGALLPDRHVGLMLNAAAFSLAHLMYWSWIVALMTFCGGLVFAHSYVRQRNFPQAVVLHAIAGQLIFAIGMGIFFYSGNVERPF
ncbi:CPBP family intramembrane glutamic endopeptidase [Actibacterium ureilyticum]|uniref:CPBP family intramembrane glutamic endopeptidase n=1 Tax=Actibacterium ureilyticum TaxID=1590614 RepID=UPI000BAAAA8A|nr:CPBP family intramembrane glutamic endopeptidase [Actibacterium ureilyticum]